METKYDKSYISDLDKIAIKEDIAKEYIKYIWIGYDYTLISKEDAQKRIKEFVDMLSNKFKIYQYNTYDKDYEIFFWCNCGDMSYVQLSSKNANIREVLRWVIDTYNGYGLVARYQYGVDYDACKLHTIADKFYEENEGKTFVLDRGAFKVKRTCDQQNRFFIMEKRKRKYGRYANDKNMYAFSKGIYNYGLFY